METGYELDFSALSETISNFSISTSATTQAVTNSNCCEKDDGHGENQIFFNPSVCTQRYLKVHEVLQHQLTGWCKTEGALTNAMDTDRTPVTLLEFGCAELRMHNYLKNIGRVEKIVFVDKDELALETYKGRIRPLTYEFLKKRETPLRVEVYSGCVTKCDPRILNIDPPLYAVIGIEIIEHLDPHILKGFERTVFGLLRPPMVILTTPNSEFNVIFNLEQGKFRHWDHRFEWTRGEFAQWCGSVCQLYGGYSYEISGIGAGGPETVQFGCVSQMAIFRKYTTPEQTNYEAFQDIITPETYSLVASENYPFFVDLTPRNDYRDDGKNEVTVAIDVARYITGMPRGIEEDLEEVRVALVEAGYSLRWNPDIRSWDIVLKVPDQDEEDHSSASDEEMESEADPVQQSEWRDGNNVTSDVDNEDWDS